MSDQSYTGKTQRLESDNTEYVLFEGLIMSLLFWGVPIERDQDVEARLRERLNAYIDYRIDAHLSSATPAATESTAQVIAAAVKWYEAITGPAGKSPQAMRRVEQALAEAIVSYQERTS